MTWIAPPRYPDVDPDGRLSDVDRTTAGDDEVNVEVLTSSSFSA
jgi:hypothetical protein